MNDGLQLYQAFPNTPIIGAIGNHESFPVDQYEGQRDSFYSFLLIVFFSFRFHCLSFLFRCFILSFSLSYPVPFVGLSFLFRCFILSFQLFGSPLSVLSFLRGPFQSIVTHLFPSSHRPRVRLLALFGDRYIALSLPFMYWLRSFVVLPMCIPAGCVICVRTCSCIKICLFACVYFLCVDVCMCVCICTYVCMYVRLSVGMLYVCAVVLCAVLCCGVVSGVV